MSATHNPFYTVGHSNRPASAFVDLLAWVGVKTLVDVRRVPRSARYPQYQEDNLRAVLDKGGVVYHWAGRQLGGFRQPRHDSHHLALEGGFRGYADYMETEAFQRAVLQLSGLGAQGSTAIMCAERAPSDCHRSLIADYLTLRGDRVLHILDIGFIEAHELNARLRRESSKLVYDRGVTGTLFGP